MGTYFKLQQEKLGRSQSKHLVHLKSYQNLPIVAKPNVNLDYVTQSDRPQTRKMDMSQERSF